MKTSNLALRLEEYAALEKETQYAERLPPRMSVIDGEDRAWSARHRLAFGTYRIQIRDCGLRPFRVF